MPRDRVRDMILTAEDDLVGHSNLDGDSVKILHEIRDAVHTFVRVDIDERAVLDSGPVQRLREIHQLALTYLVYPGTTHKRFEHSLGVMELAGRIFDVITHPRAVTDDIRDAFPELMQQQKLDYWREVLRMSALCHDLGHLPFSHGAEELLPPGWNHERFSRELILSDRLTALWRGRVPPLEPEHIVKVAMGKKEAPDLDFTAWEELLSEIIVGDVFGADRIDYLLRDSAHAGVPYGNFDDSRLIDTLRILPAPPTGDAQEASEPVLGIETGGLKSAEALLLARYFMYSQVYFHHIRLIYDVHLIDFLTEWLPEGRFPISLDSHQALTDVDVLRGLHESASQQGKPGHVHARRIVERNHFKVLYEPTPDEVLVNPDAAGLVMIATAEQFGEENVRRRNKVDRDRELDFPVRERDGTITSARAKSKVFAELPLVACDYVFVAPEIRDEARDWLKREREGLISPPEEE